MKTLKKTLCLILAVVMVVGVLILPAYAADDYTAAITALQNYKVLQGKGDGLIHADDPVTRADMAAIVYRIMTGDTEPAATANQKADAKYGAYADKFKDLTANDRWAKGYIGFCANQGVLKGDEKGNVKPNEQITGYEVQAMLLRALGYDKNNEYTGKDWKFNILADATKTGISKGVSTDPANKTPRGAVAQLTVNAAINAARVAPAVYPTVGYTSLGQSLMEIGSTSKDYDRWGAPSTIYTVTYTWPDYDVTTNPVVPDEPNAEYWTPVTQATAYQDAGLTDASAKINIYTNGKGTNNIESKSLSATDTTLANAIGGQGRWTRVYKDRIVIVDTFLSSVDSVTAEVKVNGVTAIYPSYGLTTYFNNATLTGSPIQAPTAKKLTYSVNSATSFAQYDMLASYAEADQDALNDITKLSPVDAAKVTTATVTVKAIVKNAAGNEITGFIATNGKTYLYNYTYGYNGGSSTVELAETDIGETFTLYLDAKGNVLGVEPAAGDPGIGYGVVVGADAGKIKAGQYYGELTVLTKDNTQVKVKFVQVEASGISGLTSAHNDSAPYSTEDEAAGDAELLVGNLISWEPEDWAGYEKYSAITVALNGTPANITGDKLEADDADALGKTAGKMLNDNTVFFVANYKMQNSKGGYVFTGYSVVKGFQNIQDLGYTTDSVIVDNPNAEASNEALQEQHIADGDWAKAVLVISAVNKSTNTVEDVDNYAYLADPNAFVDVYDEYYEYNAVINGKANQPLRVNYVATGSISATGLYTYSDYTNEGWKEVTISTDTLNGNAYWYANGVLWDGNATASSGTNFYAVDKNAAIYLVDPDTGTSTKVSVDLGTVQKAYDDAANKIWWQTNKYGVIDLIYVEVPVTGAANPATTALTTVTLTIKGDAAPDVGDFVKDFGLSDTITTTPAASTFNGTVKATLTWLKMNDAGEYVPYTAEAFVAGTYRVKITLSVTNKPNEHYTVGSTTTTNVNGDSEVTFTNNTGATLISDKIEIPAP